jgi:DNA-binding IclR family transcriptional regulator
MTGVASAVKADQRRSPPTERVVRLLAFLSDRPGESFGLSELARGLGISKATCLAILNELAIARILVRDTVTKDYTLGPALVALGGAAQDAQPAVRAARGPIEGLAGSLAMTWTIATIVDDRHVVIARSGGRALNDPTARVGQRFPFAPPWGIQNVAWDEDAAVEEWLAKKPLLAVDVDQGHLRRIIAKARERGYLVEIATELGLRVNATLADLGDQPNHVTDVLAQVGSPLGYRTYLEDAISDEQTYDVAMLAAPTFDERGRQDMLIALFGVRPAMPGADLRAAVETLRLIAGNATRDAGGRDPWLQRR